MFNCSFTQFNCVNPLKILQMINDPKMFFPLYQGYFLNGEGWGTDKKGNKSQSFEEDAFITIDLSTHKIKWGPLSKYSRMCGCHWVNVCPCFQEIFFMLTFFRGCDFIALSLWSLVYMLLFSHSTSYEYLCYLLIFYSIYLSLNFVTHSSSNSICKKFRKENYI